MAKGSAFLPIIELLHNYFGITGDDDPTLRREGWRQSCSELDPALETTLPFLNWLLELGSDDERVAGMDTHLRRSRILEAVVELLLSEAGRQRLILIVEDLQWLDDESHAVLDLLVDRMSQASLLLLVNYRPEYAPRWGNRPNCRQLRLDALEPDNAAEMLSAMLGESADLLPLKQMIIETTGGTPFFMEETVRALFDEGALARDNGNVKAGQAARLAQNTAYGSSHPGGAHRPSAQRRKEFAANIGRARPRICAEPGSGRGRQVRQ